MANKVQSIPPQAQAVEVVRSELRARRIEGLIHNMNSVLQIVSGHAALMKRDYPQEERCDKVIEGIRRVARLTKDLLGEKPNANCAHSCTKSALADFNLLCPGGQKRELSLKGKSFNLSSGASAHYEAFVLLILEGVEGESPQIAACDAEASTIVFQDAPMPALSEGFSRAMAGAGIEILEAASPTLRFQNIALEAM